MPWYGIEDFISIYFVILEILRFKVENLHKNCENLAMSQKQGYVGPFDTSFLFEVVKLWFKLILKAKWCLDRELKVLFQYLL